MSAGAESTVAEPLDAAVGGQPVERLVVLMPVYNDWGPAAQVLCELDALLVGEAQRAEALLIDDCSPGSCPEGFPGAALQVFDRVSVLRLRRNLGHQRALAIGLAYAEAHVPGEAIVVLDADGEDQPGDVPRLIRAWAAAGRSTVFFAERTRRTESLLFRLFYWLYRMFHLVVTGKRVRVGNFSILPRETLELLVVSPELWSHYAATVLASRAPWDAIPTTRGHRIAGQSRMKFVDLVVHGLVAISVYSEKVGVRLICFCVALFGLVSAALVGAVIYTLAGGSALPAWGWTAIGLLAVLLSQMVLLAMVFTFTMLVLRNNLDFIPRRDHELFVATVDPVYPAP